MEYVTEHQLVCKSLKCIVWLLRQAHCKCLSLLEINATPCFVYYCKIEAIVKGWLFKVK